MKLGVWLLTAVLFLQNIGERNPEEMFCFWDTKTWCDKEILDVFFSSFNWEVAQTTNLTSQETFRCPVFIE